MDQNALLKASIDSKRSELWFEYMGVLEWNELYLALVDFFAAELGFYSLVTRESPFRGSYVSDSWRAWCEEYRFNSIELPDWLGTNVLYIDGESKLKGRTFVDLFLAKSTHDLFRKTMRCIADWQPPAPDDFACFDRSGKLNCFSNAHEAEFCVLGGSQIQEYLHRSVPKLTKQEIIK